MTLTNERQQDSTSKKTTVYQVMSSNLYQLDSLLGSASGKATLASLRQSIGKNVSDSVEVWSIMMDSMPEEYLGKTSNLTWEEQSILHALQLYALYQQGESKSILTISGGKSRENMGSALAKLRVGEDTMAVDRRFNTMITATTYDELIYHLRQLIKLLKSKSTNLVKIDFAKLGQDLYWFLCGREDNIRISWARAYYKKTSNNEVKTQESK